jgi:DNA-binding MarR family transcriptional regulator
MSDPLSFDPIQEAGRQWRRHWRSAPVEAMQAVTSVMRVQQILLARLNDTLEPYGLTFARYEALMLLYFSRAGELPLGKIGARLQVHPTSVTNLIDGLAQQGLVRRMPHPTDRRVTLAAITDEGRELVERATPVLNRGRFGLEALAEEQLRELNALLREVRADADDFSPE